MAKKKAQKEVASVLPVTTGVGVVWQGVKGVVVSVADTDKKGNAKTVVFQPRSPNIERQVVDWKDCSYDVEGGLGR